VVKNRVTLYYKEKKFEYGNLDEFLDVDIVPRTMESDERVRAGRGRKKKLTKPSMKKSNARNRERHFSQVFHSNFKVGDYYITLTYNEENKPKTPEEGYKKVTNWNKKVKRLYDKAGIEFKYIIVTEWVADEW
jgi:hypothetical protein